MVGATLEVALEHCLEKLTDDIRIRKPCTVGATLAVALETLPGEVDR